MSNFKKVFNCLTKSLVKLDHIQQIIVDPCSQLMFVIGNLQKLFCICLNQDIVLGRAFNVLA